MLRRIFGLLFISGAFFVLALTPLSKALIAQTKGHLAAPPIAPVKPVTTDYYGTKVVDPYRYMENLKDPKVQAWMKAQNAYTRAVLVRIPGREKLLARIQQLDQAEPHVQATWLPGDRYLLLKQLPGDNVAKLYLRQGIDGKDKLLVDPQKVKLVPQDQGKGKNTIRYFALSPNGKYVAVGITPGGAERSTEIHVIKTATGSETGEVLLRTPYPALSWLPDSRSFVYGQLQKLPAGAPVTEIEQKMRIYLHILGSDPGKDQAVFGFGVASTMHVDPRYFAVVLVPQSSRYAIGMIHRGASPNNAVYIEPVADLGKTNSAWQKVADISDDVGTPGLFRPRKTVIVHGDNLYLLTFKNAPRSKVIRTDVRRPDIATAETVVRPSRAVVTGIHAAQDALYVDLMDGGINRLLRVPYGPKPKVKEIRLPFKGTVDVETDPRLPGAFLGMQTWAKAHRIYVYNPKTNQVTDSKLQPTSPFDNPRNIESEEVKVPSYDGTLVPLSIVHLKGVKLDGSSSTLLVGYGAYGFTVVPFFHPGFITWVEQDGLFAVCHVRGGGAYGQEWHLAGKGSTKPNTWRDFIACAQYLIKHKYTSSSRLAGFGVSAGGITIGRAITRRPDLFAAAIDRVGVSDTLRSETTANGVPNIPEFGSVKTEAGFKALYAMSPYAHVKAGTPYPAVLLLTGMNDPRVAPWQIAKMAARLQAATSSGKPILLRVDYAGGHAGIGATKAQEEETWADIDSFLLWQLGAPDFQPKK